MRTTSLLTGLIFATGLGVGSAAAAPAMPQADVLAGTTVEHVVTNHHPHLRYSGKTDKRYRMHRRHNTHMHGNPNARNPERTGYGQQLGNTSNGPRY